MLGFFSAKCKLYFINSFSGIMLFLVAKFMWLLDFFFGYKWESPSNNNFCLNRFIFGMVILLFVVYLMWLLDYSCYNEEMVIILVLVVEVPERLLNL